MKLFEYESKSLAQNLGINTPRGGLASTPDEARDIHKRIGGEVVIKAQVLVAGRGKAGGIKFGTKPEETRDRASEILSMTIKGEKVKKVLIEQKLNIKKELFGSIVLDRANKCQTVLASDQGGIDIEDRVESILRTWRSRVQKRFCIIALTPFSVCGDMMRDRSG